MPGKKKPKNKGNKNIATGDEKPKEVLNKTTVTLSKSTSDNLLDVTSEDLVTSAQSKILLNVSSGNPDSISCLSTQEPMTKNDLNEKFNDLTVSDCSTPVLVKANVDQQTLEFKPVDIEKNIAINSSTLDRHDITANESSSDCKHLDLDKPILDTKGKLSIKKDSNLNINLKDFASLQTTDKKLESKTIKEIQTNLPSNKSGQEADTGEKSKSELKAERRAIQEQQRALKAAGLKILPQKQSQTNQETKPVQIKSQNESKKIVPIKALTEIKIKQEGIDINLKDAKKSNATTVQNTTARKQRVSLFKHLPIYEHNPDITKDIPLQSKMFLELVHPEVLKIGLQMASGKLAGSNTRALATLHALKQMVRDYTTPPDKELSRDLLNHLKPNINFLKKCRTISVSMGNCIKFFKHQTTKLPSNISDTKAKDILIGDLDSFANEKIILAGQIIANEHGKLKIDDNDVILIYGGSSLVLKVLCKAFDSGKLFTVIVVDGRPKLEGRELLRKLVKHGISCTYACISALSYHMPYVSKVMMGAHGLLANGSVMSSIGSSQVALVASFNNVPVIIMCESYKFCQRVQTDSFVFNELGDPARLIEDSLILKNRSKELSHLMPLNLTYDVTPQNLISLVVTDVGLVPCTSVPVVLRVKNFAMSS